MTFDYTNMAQLAVRQIEDKGRDICYRAFSSGEYDPLVGDVSGVETTDTTIKAVVTNVRTAKIDNTALQRGDRFYLIAADKVTPNEKDRIIDGSQTFQIIEVEEIKTGDTAVAYKLLARK